MAELTTTDEARAELQRALELYAAAEVPDQVLTAIGRFLLERSHARPPLTRVRLIANGQAILINQLVDLSGPAAIRVGLPGTALLLEFEPEPG